MIKNIEVNNTKNSITLAHMKVSVHLYKDFFSFFLKIFYLSIRDTEREREREREAETQAEGQASSMQEAQYSPPRTPGSPPESKADAQPLSHPGVLKKPFSREPHSL